MLCYLGFDAYSLHQVLVEKHCEHSSQQIVCKNVVDLSLEEYSQKQLLSLSECLATILERHRGKSIHVVVDELDSEDLDKQEVNKVNSILEEPEFKTSKIVIAFQSCQKKRRFEQRGQVKKETDVCYTDLDGFKVFKLERSMRFTSSICSTLRSCQGKIEEKPNTYFYESSKPKATEEITDVEEAIAPEKLQEEGEESKAKKRTVDIRSDQQISLTSYNPTTVQESESKKKMDLPAMTIDASYHGSDVKDSDTKIISHFEYIKAIASGNNIKGDKPNFLRLKSNKHVKPLAYFIKENHSSKRKLMIICNTEEITNLARASLETCSVSFVQYTDDIDGDPPKSTSLKKKILFDWQLEKDVLLVDCRGCRGMECQEVEISSALPILNFLLVNLKHKIYLFTYIYFTKK